MTVQTLVRGRLIHVGSRRMTASPTLALVSILLGQLMLVLDLTIVNIALPDISRDLHMSPASLSWTLNAYALAFGGLLLLGARAGDLLGQRRVFMLGIGLFTLASLFGGLSQNPAELLIARAAQGVGGALAAPTGLALLMTQFREGRDRNRAVGLYGAASISGTGLGLILGGLLVAGASWRWIFFVNVPIGLGLLVLSRFSLAESTTKSGRFDLLGALSSTIGMTSLVYGFVRAATNGWSDTQALVAFAAGAALMVAFVFNESRAEAPITPLRLFADRTRSAAYVTRLLLVGGLQGMFFFLSQFLQDVLGYSPISTGIAFLPWIVAVFAGTSFASSGLGERLGHRRVLLLGLAIGTAGVLPLTFLSASSGYPQLVLSLIGWGLGSGLAFIPLTTAGISGVSREDTGAASGLLNVMQQLGGSLGLAILITVFEAASRSAQAHPGTRSSLEQAQHVFAAGTSRAFLVSGIVMAVTLLFAFVTFKTRQVRAVEPTLAQ